MTRPVFTWPVFGFSHDRRREAIATFFECGDAETFAMHPEREGFEPRNLYCAEPRRDRRAAGYRPAMRVMLTEVEHLGPGRIAA